LKKHGEMTVDAYTGMSMVGMVGGNFVMEHIRFLIRMKGRMRWDDYDYEYNKNNIWFCATFS
jgi:hypothetical protein